MGTKVRYDVLKSNTNDDKMTTPHLKKIIFVKDKKFINKRSMTLRQWLTACRLSVVDFADLMDLDRSWIYRWMEGKFQPSQKTLLKVIEITEGRVNSMELLLDNTRKEE